MTHLQDLEQAVVRQLRVRELKPARQLAEEIGVGTPSLALPLNHLVARGECVRHAGRTGRGDRAPRYSKPTTAKRS